MRRLFAATVLAAAVICIPANVVATPPQAKTFVAHLTGAQETPPNASAAQGQAIFHLNPDGTLSYKLIVANIEGVFAAHIHVAMRHVAGPVVVFLYGPTPPTGRVDGVLAEGTITAAGFKDGLAGKPMSALIAAIEGGDAYVNVHTLPAFPGGEIRGQLRAVGP
jgi:hypothetical protein